MIVAVVLIIVLEERVVVELVSYVYHAVRDLALFLNENLALMSFIDFEIRVIASVWLTRDLCCFIHKVHRGSASVVFFLLFMGYAATNLMLFRDFH